jgi:hypothetical protein
MAILPQPVSFVGSWDVSHATLPDGTFAYTGRITIERHAATFMLDWDISAGRYVGLGIALGDRLYVSCGEQLAGLGLALFTRRPDATVVVEWSAPELAGAVGTGVLNAPGPASLEGDHSLALHLPDGHKYGEWTLSIRRVDAIYELAWRKGDATHFRGLGLDTPQGLAAGWYPDLAQFAFLDYRGDPHDPHQLHAVWALGGYTTLGSETLTRL